MYRIETPRLILRPFTMQDLPFIVAMSADPEVMKYIGKGMLNHDEAKQRLENIIDHWNRYHFGLFLVEYKESGEPIGRSGICHLENTDQIEVGYILLSQYWGQGLATEAAYAGLKLGFEVLQFPEICACAQAANDNSFHVMRKLGMKYKRVGHHYGVDLTIYSVTRNEFMNHTNLPKIPILIEPC